MASTPGRGSGSWRTLELPCAGWRVEMLKRRRKRKGREINVASYSNITSSKMYFSLVALKK